MEKKNLGSIQAQWNNIQRNISAEGQLRRGAVLQYEFSTPPPLSFMNALGRYITLVLYLKEP